LLDLTVFLGVLQIKTVLLETQHSAMEEIQQRVIKEHVPLETALLGIHVQQAYVIAVHAQLLNVIHQHFHAMQEISSFSHVTVQLHIRLNL
jgi:hypothetical protein